MSFINKFSKSFNPEQSNNFNTKQNYSAKTFLLKPLWFAAGTDPYLLKNGTYSDQVKMACMGGTVYATALLAFISGSFAIKTIFFPVESNSFFIYIIGIIWSLIIFNLDRFIIASTPPNIGKSIFTKFKQAIPRILMGVVISFVISKPIELKIFEKDINQKILEDYDKERKNIENNRLDNDEQLLNIINGISSIEANQEKQSKDVDKLRERYMSEMEGKNGGVRGEGRVAKSLKEQLENGELELVKLKNQLVEKNQQKELRQDELIKLVEKDSNVLKEGMGSFVKQIRYAHEISPVISWALTILFIVLELTPIIFKLMMERAPYDFQMYDRDEVIKSKSTVFQEGNDFFSRHAKQVEKEREKELNSKDKLHDNEIIESEKQAAKKIKKEKKIFKSNLNKEYNNLKKIREFELENQFNRCINENVNHEEQRKLLSNMEVRQSYISKIAELEKLELEVELIKKTNQRKISSHEEIENKRIEEMIVNENDKLRIESLYQKQVLELLEEHNRKKIEIYRDVLEKYLNEVPNKIREELDLGVNNKIIHDVEMNDLSNKNKYSVLNDKPVFEGVEGKDYFKDAIIDNKFYKRGENYSEIKILTVDSIKEINKFRNLSANQIDILFNSEENKIITDSKIGQFKKGKDLYDTVLDYTNRMNGRGLQFNLAKAYEIHKEAKIALSKQQV